MKQINLAALLCIGVAACAQEVHFDYDRSANFNAYKTYQWVDYQAGQTSNQFMDQHIKRAIDGQLAMKGLQRVDSGADLQVAYQAAIDQEKQFDGLVGGRHASRPWDGARVTSSTIEIGKLVIGRYLDAAKKQLVWRGSAEKTLDIKKDPDKNYRNLEKAMTKLFKNYPPHVRKS